MLRGRKLDAPARVGNTIFHPGVRESLVIDRAKREYFYHLKQLPDGRWIEPKNDPFRFYTSLPEKIGDVAMIEVGVRRVFAGLPFGGARRVKVMLLQATDGTEWLVEVP